MQLNLKLKYTDSCIPIYNQSKLPYIRNERNGYKTIVLPNQDPIIYDLINPTTDYILSLIDGKRTLKEIYSEMIKQFGEEYKSEIQKDLPNTILALWMKNVIKFKKGALPNMDNICIDLKNDYKLKLAFDEDMIGLYDFLKNQDHCNVNYTSIISNFFIETQLQLRASIFNMNSLFFMLLYKEKIIGVVMIGMPILSSVATIDIVKSSEDKLKMILNGVFELITKISITKITKLRIHLQKKDNLLKDTLLELGFNKIASLEKEINDTSVDMYDYFI